MESAKAPATSLSGNEEQPQEGGFAHMHTSSIDICFNVPCLYQLPVHLTTVRSTSPTVDVSV